MPENKILETNKLQEILQSVDEIIAKYKQEIEQQVEEGKNRTYYDIPVQNPIEEPKSIQNEETKRPKAVGVFSHPAYKQKTKVVEDGGRVK